MNSFTGQPCGQAVWSQRGHRGKYHLMPVNLSLFSCFITIVKQRWILRRCARHIILYKMKKCKPTYRILSADNRNAELNLLESLSEKTTFCLLLDDAGAEKKEWKKQVFVYAPPTVPYLSEPKKGEKIWSHTLSPWFPAATSPQNEIWIRLIKNRI